MSNQSKYSQLGLKLKQAREAIGVSTRHVVTLLPKNITISHVTLTNYEAGRHQAPLDILSGLADIYQRPINWFLEKGPVLTGINYRNKKSKIGVGELAKFEAVMQQWLEAYRRLDEEFNSLRRKRNFKIAADGTGAEAANVVRKHLKLKDSDAITSVVEVMEMAGIRVMETPTELAIDALAARLGEEDVVVLNSNVPNDRSRMNAAHELGHVLFRDYDNPKPSNDKLLEKRAFEFASYFLLTKHMLRSAFQGKSMVRLVQFKERFGISLAAMIYRAEAEGILSKNQAKQLWIEFSKRGWRREEPGHVKRERASRFEQILESAIHKKNLTWQQVSKITGIREDQLRQRLNQAIGMYDPIRSPEKGEDSISFLRVAN
jgi:Zn-dependent peptidase ImmA (M78 family)